MDQVTRTLAASAFAVALCLPNAMHAQERSTLTGRVVRAGSNVVIPGAEVVLDPSAARQVTDAKGEFRFEGVRAGYAVLYVRRIGFAPESLGVHAPMSAPVDIELRETAQQLDTVNVAARETVVPRGKLAGFYERKNFGIGRFLEAKDIEQQTSRRLGDILTSRLPGTRALRGSRGGQAAYIATTRMTPNALLNAQKGAFSGGTGRPPPCYASVYLDGAVVFTSGTELIAGRPDDVLFDINSIDPSQIAAIEFYAGAGQMPAQYNKTGSACGVLVIWTK